MKACFFIFGVLLGVGMSMLLISYHFSRLPTDRKTFASALLLKKDIAHIEASRSPKNAIDYAQRTSFYLSGEVGWGDVLPPLIQDNAIVLRIRRPVCSNVSLILEGTATLPLNVDYVNKHLTVTRGYDAQEGETVAGDGKE